MENKLSPFKIALFGTLILLIIVAVFLFAFQRQSANRQTAPVTMWGTLDAEQFDYFLNKVNEEDRDSLNVNYVYIPSEEFENKLVEALASGFGPDIVLMPEELLLKHRNKLYFIDYSFYPQKTFKNSFVESGESLLTSKGFWGFPYIIDPLVLYWNRNSLNNARIANPPQTWEEVVSNTARLTSKDSNLKISKSAIALGEFSNIANAKEILLTLIMQAGNPVVSLTKDQSGAEIYDVVMNDRLGQTIRPADAALNFFSQFSNPTKDIYSWNASLPKSNEMFVSSDLALYLGFASEYQDIKRANPNLNFDVSVIPQSDLGGDKKTFAKMQFLAIPKNSPNITNAFNSIMNLIDSKRVKMLGDITGLPSVKRDLLGKVSNNAVLQIFEESAIISQGFLDPNPVLTREIFSRMVGAYTSGRSRLTDAVSKADDELTNLIDNVEI